MNLVRHYALRRNAMFLAPLALPIAFAGSLSVELAVLFGVTIALTVPTAHLISWSVERALPRYLRLVSVLVVGAVAVTVAELIIRSGGFQLAQRPLYLLRSLTVSGLMVWPTIAARRGQRLSERMVVVAGTVFGFLAGFLVFAGIRIALAASGFAFANSLAFAFTLIAAVRVAYNLMRRESASSVGEEAEP